MGHAGAAIVEVVGAAAQAGEEVLRGDECVQPPICPQKARAGY